MSGYQPAGELVAVALAKVRAIIVEVYGGNLYGSERGPLVSAYYLARIRDVVRELAPAAAPNERCTHEGIGLPGCTTCDPRTGPRVGASARACGGACAEASDLRARLVNIYHLTLTGGDAARTLLAVRAASSPGAPPAGGSNA